MKFYFVWKWFFFLNSEDNLHETSSVGINTVFEDRWSLVNKIFFTSLLCLKDVTWVGKFDTGMIIFRSGNFKGQALWKVLRRYRMFCSAVTHLSLLVSFGSFLNTLWKVPRLCKQKTSLRNWNKYHDKSDKLSPRKLTFN